MTRRPIILLLILVLVSVACNLGAEIPTSVPLETVPETATPDESPRLGPDSDLPPTWTPAPTSEVATPQVAGEAGEVQGTGGEETYTVQPGDTLAEIAAAHGVTLQALAEINNIQNIDIIEVNDVLIIPR